MAIRTLAFEEIRLVAGGDGGEANGGDPPGFGSGGADGVGFGSDGYGFDSSSNLDLSMNMGSFAGKVVVEIAKDILGREITKGMDYLSSVPYDPSTIRDPETGLGGTGPTGGYDAFEGGR